MAPPYPPATAPQSKGHGASVTSLVFGIIGMVFFWSGIMGVIGGLVGLIVGIVGVKSSTKYSPSQGMAIAGIVLGSVALFLGVIYLIVWIATLSAGSGTPSYYY